MVDVGLGGKVDGVVMEYFPWLDRERHLAERERGADEVCPECGGCPCGCPEYPVVEETGQEVTGKQN